MTGGRMIVVSAPSGSGKGSVIGRLLSIRSGIALSVSHTSRPPRNNEIDGTHYHFISKLEFEAMIEAGGFVEWDAYQGDYYGTSKEQIGLPLGKGEDIIFDITIKGAYAIRKSYPRAALVFLLPPSFEELERRLRSRGTESDEKIKGRLAEARREIRSLKSFDYYIVNEDITDAAKQLEAVLIAEKSRVRDKEADEIINSYL